MRRAMLSGLALLGLLTLAACGSSASPLPATQEPTEAPTSAPASEAPASEPAESEPATAACSESEDGTVAVTIAEFAFSPDPVSARVGDGIAWTNMDSVPHTATLDDDSCGTERLGNGDVGSLVFSAPGTYPYHCAVHPTMTGTIEISE